MTSSMTSHPAGSRGRADGARPPETIDRLMVGVCGAIWLVWLVVFVIATVACVNLGRGGGGGGDGDSPWLLYSIIAVSGVTILAAIPLLLRARRDALADRSTAEPVAAVGEAAVLPVRTAPAAEAPTEKIQIFGTAVDPARGQPDPGARDREQGRTASLRTDAVDRQWLRGTVSIFSAIGLGWTSAAVATYLLAVGSDSAAIVALVAAALATAAIPAALVVFSRRLS